MKIESQVCLPEQGKRLKALGIIQESLFYWAGDKWGIMPKSSIDFSGDPTSVFTVGELGVLLPNKIRHNKMDYTYRINKEKSGLWEIKYRTRSRDFKLIPLKIISGKIEAWLRAEMFIFLLENKFTTPEYCNKKTLES